MPVRDEVFLAIAAEEEARCPTEAHSLTVHLDLGSRKVDVGW
jgi:hypothetical protein